MEKEGSVRFRLCQKLTKNLIYSLWEQWKEEAGNSEWRVLCYVIDNGKFSIDLTYPDQIKKDEMASDRRPRAIKKYFGDAEVNYSRPS